MSTINKAYKYSLELQVNMLEKKSVAERKKKISMSEKTRYCMSYAIKPNSF